ncbi:MAG: selenocysteine-specific translation elongation factor, partial [Acidimicrobiaceae bacterium]|nr:selenocysteine-specific translation elongation factor [Acidimicrobiaceae bacterium]
MAVIATAGHIDHGKSALVRAMTGIEPDRFEEERRRGLTIDLGFGHVTSRDGTVLDIVDVPGHADYLKTMIAGMSHASIALLVIDAVEGCRAQTHEHLAVIDSIRPLAGVVALTRVDLVSGDRRVEVEREVDELLVSSPISWSRPLCTSAVTGEGIEVLVATLAQTVREVEASEQTLSELPARLFVDRVFSVSGAGTVVTGTLSSGSICAGDEFVIAGTGQSVGVRSVQRHGTNCDRIAAVRRTAINLSGVSATDLGRGDVIVAGARWIHTNVVDVQVEFLEGATMRNGKGFSAHIGSARRDVTFRPVGGPDSAQRGWFRMRFPNALPLAPRDRFLLRDNGSGVVVGVATVSDVSPVAAPSRAMPDGSIDQQLIHHGWVTIEQAERLTGRVVEPYVGRWIAAKSVIDESIATLRERLAQSTIETAECTEVERALLQVMDGVVIEHGAARIGESDPALESPLVDRLLAEGVSTGPIEMSDRKVAARLVRLGVLVSHDDVYFHVDVIRSLEPIL